MADHTEDNDPFEEDIVFDEAGLLGGKMPRSRQQATAGFLPTFMLFIRTVCLCIAFLGLGLCVSVSGSPLIRLEMEIGVSVEMALQTFTARSIGMLMGAFLGSVLFEVYNRQFLMFVSLVWVAVAVTMLPFTVPTAVWWTFVTTAALGMGLGFLFTGGNVLCLDLWGRQGGASLQALHFSFAVGAFIVPLVIQPFFVGLNSGELYNGTMSEQTLGPISTTHLARFVRDLEAENGTSYLGSTTVAHSSRLTSMSKEEIKNLTMPKSSEIPVQSKNSFNVTLPESTTEEQNKTMLHFEKTEVPTPANLSSTGKPAKMKPVNTNANKLKPDEGSWPKTSDVDNKPEKNSAAPSTETQPGSVHEVPTNPSVSMTSLSYETTIQSEVTETLTVPPQIPTQRMLNNSSENSTSQVANTSEKFESNSILKIAYPNNATNTNTDAPSTTSIAPVTTISTTLSETTSTTATPTTTTRATTTTSTPLPNNSDRATESPITPVPQIVKATYSSVSPGSSGNIKTLSNPSMVSDSGSEGLEEGHRYIPRPEVQNLREPPMDNMDQVQVDSTPIVLNIASTPSSVRHSSKPGTISNGSDESSKGLDDVAQRLKDYGVTKVHLPYICIGIFIILNALISVVILCHNPRETRSKQDDGNISKMQKGRVIMFTAIFSMFMFMSEVLQGAVHHLLASSETDSGLSIIKDSKVDGQALFWGLVCLVRFLCILVSGCLRVKPGKLLTASVLFALIGSVFMAIGSFGKEDFLWGGIVFQALGLAPILPTSLLWMAQYMRVTHRMCALMIVLSSFGNSLAHSLLTRVASNSEVYAFILVLLSFVCLFFLLVSVCVMHTAQRSKSLGVPVGYQLASQHEEEDSIELTPSGSAVFTPHDTRIRENGEAGQSLLID